MTLRHFEIFRAVARTGSFTGAARELFITQSAVSHAVREMESETGAMLFDSNLPPGSSHPQRRTFDGKNNTNIISLRKPSGPRAEPGKGGAHTGGLQHYHRLLVAAGSIGPVSTAMAGYTCGNGGGQRGQCYGYIRKAAGPILH